MGVEGLAYLCYDDRDLLKEMVATIADLVCWGLDQVLPRAEVDLGWGWEDICFRTGPLVSPDIFREVAVPGYAKIARKLRDHGVELYLVDCDGMIDALVPAWLEGGVNVMFPLEIGAWKADPAALRRRFGRELRIFGGIDKLELEKGRAAIDAEIARRLPLMKEGGYVPLPDHLITPGTPLDDYRYYLDALRRVRI
jgi:uroporphyrinogen decarboxylase